MPNNPNVHYLFHARTPSPSESSYDGHAEGIYYTTVDISLNNNLGRVTSLRNPIIQNDSLDGRLLACRHANGRDWWIIIFRFKTGQYMPLLFDNTGIHTTSWQQAAPSSTFTFHGNLGQSAFSPDGTKFATNTNLGLEIGNYITLYDFNRCEGTLSSPVQHHFNDSSGMGGATFSPNSRFLYITTPNHIYQYDTNSFNIFNNSNALIATWDLSIEFGVALNFGFAQITPNNKIFVSIAGGGRYFHTINNPNETTSNCIFTQRNPTLPTLNFLSIPNYPNFRLGPIDGSLCDTLGIDEYTSDENAKLTNKNIRIFPNPTSGNIRIEWNESLQKPTKIESINSIGQIVESIKVQNNTNYQDIDTKNLPNGIYFIRLSTAENQTYTTKLIKISD